MPPSGLVRPSSDGRIHHLISGGRCSILEHIPNPEVSLVWLHRHVSQTLSAWRRAAVSAIPGGQPHKLKIRGLEFDVQMSTEN